MNTQCQAEPPRQQRDDDRWFPVTHCIRDQHRALTVTTALFIGPSGCGKIYFVEDADKISAPSFAPITSGSMLLRQVIYPPKEWVISSAP
jgi:ABC-type phosphate transport system ATPase subunit